MTNERMDQILRQTLAPEIPDEFLNRSLKRKMEEKGMKNSKAKHFSVKKAALLTAACCLLIGTVGVASSGVINSIVSWTRPNEFKCFDQLSDAEAKAGYKIKAAEEFHNGYKFSDMSISHCEGQDKEGNVLESYKEINIDYEKAGEVPLYFHAMEAAFSHDDGLTPVRTIGINGIEVKYYVDTYKYVPVGYELTDEDEENLKRSDYYISEGADEISVEKHSSVVWIQNEIRYHILSMDKVTSAEELFGMAEELING